jgi:HlyD family secretion protein
MVTANSKLFRRKALDRAASPEQLDQAIQLVRPQHWLPLVACSSLTIAGIAWSIMGRIPITVTGQGVLIYPSTIVGTQSVGAGQISQVKVKVGDFVKKGDVLATIAQPELAKQLQLKQAKLTELQTQSRQVQSLQTNRSGISNEVLVQQQQSLKSQIQIAQKMVPQLQERQRQRQWLKKQGVVSLKSQIQLAQRIVPQLKERLRLRQWLKKQGAGSGEDVLKVQQEYLQGIEKVTTLTMQLRELEVGREDVSKVQQEYLQGIEKVATLTMQLRELNTKKPQQVEQNYQTSTTNHNQIQDLRREIAQLKGQLQQNNQVIAQQSGQILELTMTPGQVLTAGTKVATLEARSSATKLVGLSFFANGEGKQVQPGMKIEMTPNSVQRERFGGIVGTVTTVAPQPVTPEGAAKLIGNPTIAQSLMGQESKIQVAAKLQTDPVSKSRFQWSSSKGPDFKISSGSMTNVRITVEERAPITFALPFLKSWMGQANKPPTTQPSESSQLPSQK